MRIRRNIEIGAPVFGKSWNKGTWSRVDSNARFINQQIKKDHTGVKCIEESLLT